MPGHYSTVKGQLTLDVEDTLGPGGRIIYGRFIKPKTGGAAASIFTSVDRAGVGRHVNETYSFRIALYVPLPPPDDLTTDVEGALMEYAEALTQRLAPFSLEDVPVSADLYAGVAKLRRVTSITPLDREEQDKHVGIMLDFSCQAKVFQ